MKKYMINIFYGTKANASHPNDDEFVMQKYQEWSKKLSPRTLAAHKLKDGEGKKLVLSNNKVTDGPYIETKESIGGFYVIEAKNYEQAVEDAKECPTLLYQGGYVEVREVEF